MLDEGLVDRLYEAAVIPERWPDLLADLAEIAESPAGILMGFAPASPQNGKMIASPAYAEIAKQFYSGGWGANNARFAVGAQNGSAFQSRFISEEDIFPAGYPFEREGLYKDLLIPGGLGRSIGSVFSHAHGDVVILTFERPLDAGPPSTLMREALDRLRPTLARASLIAYRLAFERVRGAVDTLARLALPAAAVRASGQVVVCNDLFEHRAPIAGFDKVKTKDANANAMLAAALSNPTAPGAARSIPVRNEDGRLHQVLHILPVRREAHDVFVAAEAILVVSESTTTPRATPILQAMFDLTQREAEIAGSLAAGRSLAEIAAERGTSIETVRNQLKSIFAKTGCNRQRQLAQLVLELLPANRTR